MVGDGSSYCVCLWCFVLLIDGHTRAIACFQQELRRILEKLNSIDYKNSFVFLRRVLVFCLGADTTPRLRTACFGHRCCPFSVHFGVVIIILLFHIRKFHIPRTSNDTAARRDRSQPTTLSVGSTRSYCGIAHVKIRKEWCISWWDEIGI